MPKAKLEEKFSKFLNMFKKIEIYIPFYKALTHMPHYTKFIKDILSIKKRIAEEGVVSLTATCIAVILKFFQGKCRIQASSLYLAKL